MPVNKGSSGLAAKYGAKVTTAVKKHKTDETRHDAGGSLPEGIEGGIAKLVTCGFGQYKAGTANAGEWFFRAAGVVVEPVTHNGQRVAGLQTSIMEPLCDTPGRSRETTEQHVEWILNEMRKLGLDTAEFGEDDLEAMAASLKEAEPHFAFRTWKGQATEQFPNPRVNEVWKGIVEYSDDGSTAESAVEDKTEPAPKPAPKASTNGKGGGNKAAAAQTPDAPWEGDNLDELASAADEGDADAAEKLAELAKKAGVDSDSAESWAAVAEELKAQAGGESADDAAEESADFVPDKGDVYLYKPKNAKKAIECEVVAVISAKKLANLKNMDDGKTVYKSVPWSELSPS